MKSCTVTWRRYHLWSGHLSRCVRCDVYHPWRWHRHVGSPLSVVIFHDGQDLPRMGFRQMVCQLWRTCVVPHFVAVGLHASSQRLWEYGISGQPDYEKRGYRAQNHARFVVEELWPWLHSRFRLLPQAQAHIVAGFSLSALSAFDLAWHHSELFGQVGVFPGSLWWRS